jgi:hypothetical protein
MLRRLVTGDLHIRCPACRGMTRLRLGGNGIRVPRHVRKATALKVLELCDCYSRPLAAGARRAKARRK